MKRSLLVLFLSVRTSVAFCQAPFQKSFGEIDKYIDSMMHDWNIPGLAIGIVYKDQLMYSKGFGYRDLQQKLPMQPTTIFPIASNTKLFTATVATMLAEEGKLNLDEPVRNYSNVISFFNDELNSKVTLRDMLSHRTGLPAYDYIWVGSNDTRRQNMAKVAYMKPAIGFREGYIYNNMMYAAAGFIMENITGKSWENLVRERILQPLKMNSTSFITDTNKLGGDYSQSYFEQDSTRLNLVKKFEAASPGLGAAGTMRSTIEDLSHWMIAQLNAGKYQGAQVISAKAIQQTLVPNIIADKAGIYDELSNALYAMGRTVLTYKGYKIASHTGSLDGFYSNFLLIPSQGLGVFMVVNGEAGGSFRSAMAYTVIDKLLRLPYTPWSQRYLANYKTSYTAEVKYGDSLKATQVKGTNPSHALAAYTGTYINPMYGSMKIVLNNNTLSILYMNGNSTLSHFHYDQFITDQKDNDFPGFRLNFLTGYKGEIDRLSTSFSNNEADVFTRQPGL